MPAPVQTQQAAFTALFETADCTPVDVAILQAADPFLETAGEDLRRRMFMTTGPEGEELCLRPDFTIPVCLQHLAAKDSLPRRYSYFGPVFRQRFGNGNVTPSEFLQTGVEDLGDHTASLAKDADILALAVQAARAGGAVESLHIRLGEPSLFETLLTGLDLPNDVQTRLVRNFRRGYDVDALVRPFDPNTQADLDWSMDLPGLSQDRERLADQIATLMAQQGFSKTTGRSPANIADRLLEKYGQPTSGIDASHRARVALAVRDFLDINVPSAQISSAFQAFQDKHAISFGARLDDLIARHAQFMTHGVSEELSVTFSAQFARALDYYTGFVFEIYGAHTQPIVAGGRYDRLIEILGASSPVPAVGFSLWVDRLTMEAEQL